MKLSSFPERISFLLLLLLFAIALMTGCTKTKNSPQKNSEINFLDGTVEGTSLFPLLKSFGFQENTSVLELAVPMPTGASQRAVFLSGMHVGIKARTVDVFRRLLPLYGANAISQVHFQAGANDHSISDLLSPAAQAVVNHEIQFNPKAPKLNSSDALFTVLLSEGRSLKFVALIELRSLLFDNHSFRLVGGLPISRQTGSDKSRERNSGFAVGDIVVFQEGNTIKHAALWLDHDLYFEALVFARSVLYRLASWQQLIDELSLRNQEDLRKVKATALRRVGAWSGIAQRFKKIKDQKNVAEVYLNFDSRGRAEIGTASGGVVIPRLRGSAADGVFPQGNRR